MDMAPEPKQELFDPGNVLSTMIYTHILLLKKSGPVRKPFIYGVICQGALFY
jgi:hypothetical protein